MTKIVERHVISVLVFANPSTNRGPSRRQVLDCDVAAASLWVLASSRRQNISNRYESDRFRACINHFGCTILKDRNRTKTIHTSTIGAVNIDHRVSDRTLHARSLTSLTSRGLNLYHASTSRFLISVADLPRFLSHLNLSDAVGASE